MSRTKKSAINSVVGIVCMLISSLLSFALQAVFIRLLGLEYSGVNGLFTDILKILNLAELGISNAIMFRLYKHIADNDQTEIEKVLSFYRKFSYAVGLIILFVGLLFVPFLHFFVKEVPTFPESLWSLYIIVLATSVLTQFNHYKSVLILAKQDRYIYSIVTYSIIFLKHILQILVLWLFGNIYLYLLVPLFTTFLSGIVMGTISKRRYSHSFYSKEKLTKEEKKEFTKDAGMLSVYKLCRTLDATVDTFLISKFISVATSAIYASFSMLLTTLTDLFCSFNDAIIASVGDLHASGEKEKVESVFYQSLHFNYLIFGISTSVLAAIISPFVEWWIGHTLSTLSIVFLLINFYIHALGQNVSTFRNSMGLFRKGWKQPAVTVTLNVIFSLILVQKMGLPGTLIGTFIAGLLTRMWYDPYIVCKHGFDKKPYKYYFRYIYYFAITIITAGANIFIAKTLNISDGILGLVVTGFVCLFVSVIFLLLFGFVVKEQKLLLGRIKNIIFGFLKK